MIPYTVFKRDGRQFFEVQFVHPTTGKKKTKSTKLAKKRDADRWAAKFIDDLCGNGFSTPGKMKWAEFVETYPRQKRFASTNSDDQWSAVAEHVTKIIDPQTVGAISTGDIETLKTRWRESKFSEHTVRTYLAYLKAALNWAKRHGLISRVPHFEIPTPQPSPKGRPISGEEFDRIKDLAKRKRRDPESWAWFLNGLWWSGMRIEEAMRLHWTDGPVTVDTTGKFPLICFAAEGHKARRAELSPIAPEFVEMLLSVPEGDRTGFVFNPISERTGQRFTESTQLGTEVARLGKRAGVKVMDRDGKTKYASAHDLRRSFGSRWAKRVMPAVLMRMMRHKTISTTMAFYAVDDAESVAQTAWDAFANTFANTTPENVPVTA